MRVIWFALSLSICIAGQTTRYYPQDGKLRNKWIASLKSDSAAFANTIFNYVESAAGISLYRKHHRAQPTSFWFYHDKESRPQDEDCPVFPLCGSAGNDLVLKQAQIHGKHLGEYLTNLIENPRSVQDWRDETRYFGYQPSQATAECLNEWDGQSYDGLLEMGGGSGAGFQIYCGNVEIVSAGGGGGGGLFINAKNESATSYGGGGGGGVQIFGQEVSTGSGGGGGYDTGGIYKSIIDDNLKIPNNIEKIMKRLKSTIRECQKNGTLWLMGGGGGGGGKELGYGRRHCGYGYGFAFTLGSWWHWRNTTEPDEDSGSNNITSNSTETNPNDLRAYFAKGSRECHGYKNWTCVCNNVKEQMKNAFPPGEEPYSIKFMSCKMYGTEYDNSNHSSDWNASYEVVSEGDGFVPLTPMETVAIRSHHQDPTSVLPWHFAVVVLAQLCIVIYFIPGARNSLSGTIQTLRDGATVCLDEVSLRFQRPLRADYSHIPDSE